MLLDKYKLLSDLKRIALLRYDQSTHKQYIPWRLWQNK